jgi:hypothetical protein
VSPNNGSNNAAKTTTRWPQQQQQTDKRWLVHGWPSRFNCGDNFESHDAERLAAPVTSYEHACNITTTVPQSIERVSFPMCVRSHVCTFPSV